MHAFDHVGSICEQPYECYDIDYSEEDTESDIPSENENDAGSN